MIHPYRMTEPAQSSTAEGVQNALLYILLKFCMSVSVSVCVYQAGGPNHIHNTWRLTCNCAWTFRHTPCTNSSYILPHWAFSWMYQWKCPHEKKPREQIPPENSHPRNFLWTFPHEKLTLSQIFPRHPFRHSPENSHPRYFLQTFLPWRDNPIQPIPPSQNSAECHWDAWISSYNFRTDVESDIRHWSRLPVSEQANGRQGVPKRPTFVVYMTPPSDMRYTPR